MQSTLAIFSQSIAQLVADAATVLAAIRVGPNRHMTGLVCEGDIVITTDQELPALDSYTVVLPQGRLMGARPGLRDPAGNLAVLRLEGAYQAPRTEMATVSVGNLALIVGAEADASPTVRLTVVHRFVRTADGPAPMLDASGQDIEPGNLVLDVEGRLIGLAALGPHGQAMVVPGVTIARTRMPTMSLGAIPPMSLGAVPAPPSVSVSYGRRGWLGVSLQPITVPDTIVARAGQSSGRMVVSIAKGGPAEHAGVRVGDVLLALNGISTSGPHALRDFLETERIGSIVEIRLLRDGNLHTTQLTLAAQPG